MSKVTISEFIISVVELVEAQVDEIRYSMHKSAEGLIFLLVSALLIFTAIVFALIGIRLLFVSIVGEVFSYFIVSAGTVLVALFFMKVASWKVKKKQS
ncbi:MAG: hypothetical protein ACLFQJ_01155 [Campylobacterales bacterium]